MKNINLHILKANQLLKEHYSKLKKEFDLALKQISQYIPVQDVDILVSEGKPAYGGSVYSTIKNNNLIIFIFDTKHKDFKNKLRDYIIRPLAYDLYLINIYQKYGNPKTLLEDMLIHGVTLHFELSLVNFSLNKHYNLSKSKIAEFIQKNRRFFNLKNYNVDKWFCDTGKNKKPYMGRVLGYFMIKKYL